MADSDAHFDPIKELACFESSNQWILFDDRFQRFFDFFAQNIREPNVLTEHEALESDEIGDLNKIDDSQQKQKLKEHLPSLLKCDGSESAFYSTEICAYAQAEQHYIQLLELARVAKSKPNARLSELEDKNSVLATQEKELYNHCHCQAKQLEALQEGNKKLYEEARKCFTRVLSPPMLFFQLPLDQYFAKCDAFLQYFTLYIQENYKIQEFQTFDSKQNETEELTLKLTSLKSLIVDYSLKFFEEKMKAKAIQAMIDELDLKQIHTVNLNDLERELYDFELLTEHHLKVAHETLRNDLNGLMLQQTQQRIELVLYENTKNKLERALKRLENDKDLIKITSDALLNADLVWIATQLDWDRISNRIDNTKQLTIDSQACLQRIKAMHTLNNNITSTANGFLESLADLLTKTSNTQRVRTEVKACLYEYEKFCRLLAYGLQNMISGRSNVTSKEQLKELKRLESLLEPLVYDSPIEAPVLYNVALLRPIHNAKMNHIRNEKNLRHIRTQFHTCIVEKMEKEPLWRASQMLWVWFLKQPKRLLMAIEEVKRAATNVPAVPGVKNLSGIKRK